MEEEYKIKGLTSKEVNERIELGEVNKGMKHLTRSYKSIFTSNIFTLFNLINIVVAGFIAYTGSYENLLFLGVVVSNIFIGIIQEIRAKRSIDKLSLLSQSKARVVRDGEEIVINQEEIVRDDLLVTHRGDEFSIDGIVEHSDGLEVDESQITGESDSVSKKVGDKVMSGSFAVSGSAYIRAKNVGSDSYASKLSTEATKHKDIDSELIRSMKRIIKGLTIAIIPIGILLFASNISNGIDVNKSILGTSAAMIGMIPSGLMLITSIALAVGVVKLAKRGVLVKTMGSIENLARVDLLCLDKTGTITNGKIRVVDLIPYSGIETQELKYCIEDLISSFKDENQTNTALKRFLSEGENLNFDESLHLDRARKKSVVPFSSARKWSGVTFEDRGTLVMGAPESIFKKLPKEIEDRAKEATSQGKRVIVFAKAYGNFIGKELPNDLNPIGICIMEDEIRPDAGLTLDFFRKQGVDVRIISGDNAQTVSKIATMAGVEGSERYIDMSSIDDDEDMSEYAREYVVFGRVRPEQKKNLVKAYKEQGHTVGMTGDGVNDILALRESDCSIAMAEGSDAAKEVSDFVLLQSNFEAMIRIMGEGRRVVNNIGQVASQYLMKTIYSMILAAIFIFMDSPYPFKPIQLMPITAFGVGIPSFFLALRPNYSRIRDGFLRNVMTSAFSSGISVVFYIVLVMIVGYLLRFDYKMISTLCVITTGSVCFTSLFRVAHPLNKRISFMLMTLVGVFVALIFAFRGILSLDILNYRVILVALPMVASVLKVYKYIGKIVEFLIKKYKRIKNNLV
ncbi:MAG: HAD-IC family P-type ATPase [Clostridioides sp.]|jgi:cation-transporting ATPase E|nr:HAD-IC family P-type ATPase [Clostridioides sp.]